MTVLASVFALVLLATPIVLEAQQAEKVYRIGSLSGGSQSARSPLHAACVQGMRDLGYVEGRNYVLESRYADGKFERLPSLAQELIRLNPDLLFVSTTPGALAAKAATMTIPIVFVAVADPVGVGIVPDLARSGGNITGITNIVAELTGKRLELLKEMIPGTARIDVLVNPGDPNAAIQLRNAEAAARTLKVQLNPVLSVRGAGDLDAAFEAAVRSGATVALRMVDPTVTALRVRTAELAAKHRLPVIYPFREDAEAGGLLAYGASLPAQYQQAATLVHKILRGARPGDLPVEQPTKFELVINVKTAKLLNLTTPPSLLLRADLLIE